MTRTRIIGDIHGKISAYSNLLIGVEESIQVGDFGIGFLGKEREEKLLEFNKNYPNHWFIRGNHDHPQKCTEYPNYVYDGFVKNDIMFVGGAWSIDHASRLEGFDWWQDEECSIEELNRIIELYALAKPRVMITHDCPESVSYQLFCSDNGKLHYKTRTGQALQAMFEIHKPDLWVFGHWHMDIDQYVKNTRFICLDELTYIDVDMDTLDIKKPKSFGQPHLKRVFR